MPSPEILAVFAIKEFFWHIAPASIGALIGASAAALLTGWMLQKHFTKRKNEADFVDFLVDQLHEIRKIGTEYWLIDLRAGLAAEKKERVATARGLEAMLKGAVDSLTVDLEAFGKKYNCESQMTAFSPKLVVACTGGSFEVANRAADPSRIDLIVGEVNRIRSALLHRKM